MRGGTSYLLAVIVLVLCLSGVAVADTGTHAAGSSSLELTDSAPQMANEEAENETARHQNPDEYGEGADDEQLESWLSDRLTAQLEESTLSLSEGEYDRARDHVDEEYHDYLEQYVEVDAETESTGTDERDAASEYEEAANEQEQLTDRIEEYEETKDAYETALENDDEERAHELARELEELHAEINDAGENVVTSYENISAETDEDLAEASATVDETQDEINREQAAVREEQFVRTELHLNAEGEAVSFGEPLVVHGEVETADGSTPDSETIQLRVDGEPMTTDLEADGSFRFEYRPTDLNLSAESVPVEYVPDDESTRLGSEAEFGVAPEQSEPTIEGLDVTTAVAYDERIRISGELTVDETPVDGVPLVISVDGERLGTLNATDGTFSGSGLLPAAVADGDQSVQVSLPFEGRALAGTTANVRTTVAETESDLTVDATAIGETEFAFEGALETDEGDGIEGAPIRLRFDDATGQTVTTDTNGEFADTAEVPPSILDDGDDVTVTAVHDGAGSSLTGTTAETVVPTPGGEGSVPVSPFAALFAVVTVATAGWWHRARSGDEQAEHDPEDDNEAADDRSEGSEPDSSLLVDSAIERAADHVSNENPDLAVRSCYAAVRHAHIDVVGGSDAFTHWEFYYRYAAADATSDASVDALRELIESYERAAFGSDPVPEATALRALERTRALSESSSRSNGTETPDVVLTND
jgi:hypothetical protein